MLCLNRIRPASMVNENLYELKEIYSIKEMIGKILKHLSGRVDEFLLFPGSTLFEMVH